MTWKLRTNLDSILDLELLEIFSKFTGNNDLKTAKATMTQRKRLGNYPTTRTQANEICMCELNWSRNMEIYHFS